MRVHDCSPVDRGISLKISRECDFYIPTHYYPDQPLGQMHQGFRNEDVHNQTFANDYFDLVLTLDVAEHVSSPEQMFKEIYRTLKRGGAHICTFPIRKGQTEGLEARVELTAGGELRHIKNPPEYHGNPIDASGSLVWSDFGYDIHKMIASWAPFDVEVIRFADRLHGIIGEYTEVLVCWKREPPGVGLEEI